MNDTQLLRYSRHILLDAHALIGGPGGPGSRAALYLASGGIGRITLVGDEVDLTDLQLRNRVPAWAGSPGCQWQPGLFARRLAKESAAYYSPQ